MTADELKGKIQKVFDSEYTVQVYFVLQKKGEFVIKLADIEDKTEPEMRSLFSKELKEAILDNGDLRIDPLSTADENPNSIYLYDYDSYPDELGLFKNFDITTAIKLDKFNFKKDNLSELFGYIIYLGSMYNGVTLFKKHYHVTLIKRDSFLLGISPDKERFVKMPATDIIRLSGAAQLIRLNNDIYVTDINMLERNLGFTQLLGKAAEESIKAISSLKIIEDTQVLKDALDDLSFVRKIAKIKKASQIFKLEIDGPSIIKFTKETNALKGKFKYTEDGNQIRLDTKKSKNDFLALMNDAFLVSELTKQYYQASSKDDIT